jgi:hypothetical protein
LPVGPTCRDCGLDEIYVGGICTGCWLHHQLDDRRRTAPRSLLSVLTELESRSSPKTVLGYLRGPGGRTLTAMCRGELGIAHEVLDRSDRRANLDELRELLVRHGALPWRDELAATVAALLQHRLPELRRESDHGVIRMYADALSAGASASRGCEIRGRINAVIDFAALCPGGLAMRREADLDTLSQRSRGRYDSVMHFYRWAERAGISGPQRQRRTTRRPPRFSTKQESQCSEAERQRIVAWLLRDERLDSRVRVAGLLMAFHGMYPAAVAFLRLEHLVREGSGWVLYPPRGCAVFLEPEVAILLHHLGTQRSVAAQTSGDHSDWFFPGHNPACAILPNSLSRLLRRKGIHPKATVMAAHRFWALHTSVPSIHRGSTGASATAVYEYRRHVGVDIRRRVQAGARSLSAAT